jgi:cytochrome b
MQNVRIVIIDDQIGIFQFLLTRSKGVASQETSLTHYPVWDRTVRLFHWVNVLCILGLIAIGTVVLNSKALGVTNEGKILLKTLHVYIGYVFVVNLVWRLIWGFIGNRFARWKAILPVGDRYKKQRLAYFNGFKQGKPVAFLGHNPLARWMVSLLFLLLSTMAVTGLVLGGTDVYMAPFGVYFKSWVAESPGAVDKVKPYSDEGVDKDAYETMREFRKPFIKTHYYGFLILLAAIVLHLFAVIVTELRERCGLVSAMFSGEKVFNKKPLDYES